jgi:hypothetical protein
MAGKENTISKGVRAGTATSPANKVTAADWTPSHTTAERKTLLFKK